MCRLNKALESCASVTLNELESHLPKSINSDSKIVEAMRYSLFAGGKRLRPFLVLSSSDLFNVPRSMSVPVAAAIEMVHTYSLIHDDLPAMDDDDLRRGKKTCHKKFDEATAILAGDALLTLAFEVLSNSTKNIDPAIQGAIIQELAKAAGSSGMVGGQAMDLEAEKTLKPLNLNAIKRMQRLKTGALIRFSCEAGAILADQKGKNRVALKEYADAIGLAFQIADDLLDYEGDATAVGKATGKDAKAGKATFVSLLGANAAREQAELLVSNAINHLTFFGARAQLLEDVARYIINRKS